MIDTTKAASITGDIRGNLPAPLKNQPFLLTPTIVVALDDQGVMVAHRLASLVRAHIRDLSSSDAEAVRDRFRFIQLTHDQHSPLLTEVQAIVVDPSAYLWNVADETWQVRALRQQQATSFASALRHAIKAVLSYPEVEEDLRDRNIVIQPSQINVFFTGSLVHTGGLSPEELDAALAGSSSGTSDVVGDQLETIREIAMQVRRYAEESASLDLVVRGAFLSLVLPRDSFEVARASLQQHGTTFGRLLRHSVGAVRLDSYDYKEPPLHFCSFYTDHDERGAWYEPEQVTNVIASAIYALMQSELLSHNICATQLGLRDPYANPYERLVAITATRSSVPRADLLDYAALHYGGHLLDHLLPPMSGPLSANERDHFEAAVKDLIDYAGLESLIAAGPDWWTVNGEPSQLTAIATEAAYPPPNLSRLIRDPRVRWWTSWSRYTEETLAELERLDLLSIHLDPEQPLVDGQGTPRQLIDPESGNLFMYEQEPLLREWQRWREAVESHVNDEANGQVMRRVRSLSRELDQTMWGNVPKGFALSGTRYAWVVLELSNSLVREVQGRLQRQSRPTMPTEAEIEAETARVRQQANARSQLAPIAALTLIFWPLLAYLLIAIRASGANDSLTALLRRSPIVLTIPGLERQLSLSIVLLIATGCALLLFSLGLLIRQWQTIRAVRSMRRYTRLIRRKYALLQYHDEQRQIEQALQDLLDYQLFLQRTLHSMTEATRRAAERLRERATAISDRGFKDVAEYLPTARGGPLDIYKHQIRPRMDDHTQRDLPLIRQAARQRCSLDDLPFSADLPVIQERAAETLLELVLGDAAVSEQDPRAQLRYLAYHALQGDLEEVVQQTVTRVIANRAQDLQQRTHLLLRTGYHPTRLAGQTVVPFQQEYLVSTVHAAGEQPDLAETLAVRGLDEETVMYVRVMNGIWPRLFEGAGLVLTEPGGATP